MCYHKAKENNIRSLIFINLFYNGRKPVLNNFIKSPGAFVKIKLTPEPIEFFILEKLRIGPRMV